MTKKLNDNTEKDKLGVLNLIVFVLTIYVLVALIIDTFFRLPTETSKLLNYIDIVICIFFFIEFIIRFYQAENKLKFMKWGWIDLVSSIPMIGFLRAGRVIRLIRLIRILRAFRSTKHFVEHVFKNKAKGTLSSVLVISALLVIFASIAILQVENNPNSNIKTAEDAIWWAYVTITTVGYGDKFPVTTEGRIIAAVLMTAGVGLFGTFTAYIASLFVSDKKTENNNYQ
jgi:voltage-gated potassium channel